MDEYLIAPVIDEAARAACMALGLDYRYVAADGTFHRLTINGRGKDGSLCLFTDGQGGIAWNFKTGEQRLFFAESPDGLSECERRSLRRQHRERAAQARRTCNAGYALAAARAQRLWQRLRPAAASHSYLARKGVQSHGARTFRDMLIIPVMNGASEITSLQMIAANGDRRFLKGSRVAGCFHVLGDAATAPAFIIAEGFATAASLHEATDLPVVVAFFAGNLAPVTEHWRQKRPEARIIIAADDDWQTAGNPGSTKANEAASQFGAHVALPVFTGVNRVKGDTDFNDLAHLLGPATVRCQIEAMLAATTPRLHRSGPYEATGHGLYGTRETRDGVERQRLANFAAWVVAERIVDDGAERHKFMDIEAEIHGRSSHFTIPVAAFPAMNWPIEHIGVEAVIEPGFGIRERARAAIQYLSGPVRQHHTYAHTGWRKLDEHGWCYLHPGGAIGAHGPLSGIDVNMPEALAHYRLPTAWTAEELKTAMRASLQILGIAPGRVTVPLIGASYRAVLGAADFSLHLAGRTGSGKSELAALAQQHYGPEMTARRLPGAWFSTANQLEGLAFAAKDAVFVIDEFVPEGTAADRARLQQTASRLLRGVGNGSGRGRADKNGNPRAVRPPRALVISTGEEIPSGQSLRARTLVIQVAHKSIGDGDLRVLKPFQEAALSGLYATAMAGFIQWLAVDFETQREAFAEQVEARRQCLAALPGHARTASIGTQLATIWRFITRFGVACGAIDEEEAAHILRRADDALAIIGEEQADIQAANDPVERFRDLLNGAVASGRAHIASPEGQAPAIPSAMGWRKFGADWQSQGHCIGWEDGAGGLYLEPEASFAAVQAMGEATDDRIGVSGTTLRKLLHERGLLLTVESESGKTHLAVRRTIGGRRRRVLHLPNLLHWPDGGGHGGPDPDAPQDAAHPRWANGNKWASDDEAQLIEKPHQKDPMAHTWPIGTTLVNISLLVVFATMPTGKTPYDGDRPSHPEAGAGRRDFACRRR